MSPPKSVTAEARDLILSVRRCSGEFYFGGGAESNLGCAEANQSPFWLMYSVATPLNFMTLPTDPKKRRGAMECILFP